MTPVIYTLFFFITGILLSNILPLKIIIALLFLYLLTIFFIKNKKYYFLFYSLFIIIGAFYSKSIYNSNLYKKYPDTISFTGLVISEPINFETYNRFILKTHFINDKKENKKLLVIYKYSDITNISMGDIIKGIGTLQKRKSLYLLGNGIEGIIDVKLITETKKSMNYYYFLNKIRKYLYSVITYGIIDKSKFLISGLILGKREDIDLKIQQNFSDSGTIHILAVSGLHLGIIALYIFLILNFFTITKKNKLLILSVFIIFYVLLIGNRPSIIRAGIMTICGILIYLFDKDRNYWNVVALSALIMLFYNPFYIYNLGFQLSYSAVLGILTFNKYFSKVFSPLPKILKESLSASFSAQILILPLVLIYFHKIVFISFIANLFIIPLAAVIIGLGFISLFLSLFKAWFIIEKINLLNSLIVKLTTYLSYIFSKVFFIRVDVVNIFLLLSIITGIITLILFIYLQKYRKTILVFSAIFIITLFIGITKANKPHSIISIPNIGKLQNIVLLKTENKKNIVFLDATDYNFKRIQKFLINHNIRKIDDLFLMSYNYSVIEKLNNYFPIENIYTTKNINIEDRLSKKINIIKIPVKKKIKIDNVIIKCEICYKKSIIYRIITFNTSILLLKIYNKEIETILEYKKLKCDTAYIFNFPYWINPKFYKSINSNLFIYRNIFYNEGINLIYQKEISIIYYRDRKIIQKKSWK